MFAISVAHSVLIAAVGNREKQSSLFPVLIPALTKLKVRCVAAGETHCGAVIGKCCVDGWATPKRVGCSEKGQIYMWGSGEEVNASFVRLL